MATTATLNFGGLAPGAQYALRYYYRQWDAGDFPPRPVQFVFNGDGTNATFETDEDVGGAYYLEYDFTAASGTVSLVLTDESGVANDTREYAITLQSAAPVPLAPSSERNLPAGTTRLTPALTLAWRPVARRRWLTSGIRTAAPSPGRPAPRWFMVICN